MLTPRSLSTLLCLFFATAFLHAQKKAQPITDFRVITKHTGETYKNTPTKAVDDADEMYVIYSFKVTDWSNIAKFHVNLGKKNNESKDKQLVIDVKNPDATLPGGVSYSVKDDQVYIVMGGYKEMKKYVASIIIEDAKGTKSDPIKSEKE